MEEKSQNYDDDVAKKLPKWRKLPTLQRKSQTFDAAKPITIFSFLNYFKLSCDTNRVQADAATSLPHLFMKNPVREVLNVRPCLKPKYKGRQAKVKPTSFCKVFSYFLSTYTTEDVIAKAYAQMTTSKQPANINPVGYSQSQCLKAFKFGSGYDESMLKGMFI